MAKLEEQLPAAQKASSSKQFGWSLQPMFYVFFFYGISCT
jgi:hypothetical protein